MSDPVPRGPTLICSVLKKGRRKRIKRCRGIKNRGEGARIASDHSSRNCAHLGIRREIAGEGACPFSSAAKGQLTFVKCTRIQPLLPPCKTLVVFFAR